MENDKLINTIAEKVKEVSSQVNPDLWNGIELGIAKRKWYSFSSTSGKMAYVLLAGVTFSAMTYFAISSTKENKDKEGKESKEFFSGTSSNGMNENKTEATTTENKASVSRSIDSKKETSYRENKGILNLKLDTSNSFTSREKGVSSDQLSNNEGLIFEEGKRGKKDELVFRENKNTKLGQEVISEKSKMMEDAMVFSPNGDGKNDEFYVNAKDLKDYSIVIVNKNGSVVWKSTDPSAKWKGMNIMGEVCPKGMYSFTITGKDSLSNPVLIKRNLRIQ